MFSKKVSLKKYPEYFLNIFFYYFYQMTYCPKGYWRFKVSFYVYCLLICEVKDGIDFLFFLIDPLKYLWIWKIVEMKNPAGNKSALYQTKIHESNGGILLYFAVEFWCLYLTTIRTKIGKSLCWIIKQRPELKPLLECICWKNTNLKIKMF